MAEVKHWPWLIGGPLDRQVVPRAWREMGHAIEYEKAGVETGRYRAFKYRLSPTVALRVWVAEDKDGDEAIERVVAKLLDGVGLG